MKLPPTFSKNESYVNAVIETPKGCAAKYNYDEETGMFRLKKILPEGMVFPFHFGFLPFTRAEDGDPLDVLVLLDEPAWPGCLITCNIIGVLEAEEMKKGQTIRNDRLIATAKASEKYNKVKSLYSLDKYLEKEIENFFNTYTALEKKALKIIGKRGRKTAINLIKKNLVNGNNK
jgi:inorganic pyrophosphatase